MPIQLTKSGEPFKLYQGWGGVKHPEIIEEEFAKLSPQDFIGFYSLSAQEDTNRVALFEVAEKLLGSYLPSLEQEIGDCVSWGMKHAVELLQCCEILINGDREEFKRVFAPLIYGTSRVQIGGGRISGDGSVGSWAAEAVKKFGILFEDAEGCPPYSGSVARAWGKRPGPPQKFLDIAKAFPVKSTAAVTTWDELVAAIFNFYPVTVASDIGYSMLPGNDGYHIQNTSWAHQMCIAGVDKGGDGIEPHGYIWNSWGNVHGRLKDFRTGKELPPGYLRVKKRDIEKMLRQKDSWAISSFEGFKSRKLPKSLFVGM